MCLQSTEIQGLRDPLGRQKCVNNCWQHNPPPPQRERLQIPRQWSLVPLPTEQFFAWQKGDVRYRNRQKKPGQRCKSMMGHQPEYQLSQYVWRAHSGQHYVGISSPILPSPWCLTQVPVAACHENGQGARRRQEGLLAEAKLHAEEKLYCG
jgi:hypothetical protein